MSMSIGCAGDTLIVAEEATVNKIQERANATLDIIFEHIRHLDLCLTIDKTQPVLTRQCGQAT